MAEYLIQGETLTGIADKIRPLLGLTGTMTPEQMQTNLTTEQANIAAALAALTEKGVEVPTGANSNALAGLIAAIESGGGSIVTGEVVWSEITTLVVQLTIEHNFGRIPKIFVIVPNFSQSGSTTKKIGLFVVSTKEIGMLARTSSSTIYINPAIGGCKIVESSKNNFSSSEHGVFANEEKLHFRTYIDSLFGVTAGDSYRWFVAG